MRGCLKFRLRLNSLHSISIRGLINRCPSHSITGSAWQINTGRPHSPISSTTNRILNDYWWSHSTMFPDMSVQSDDISEMELWCRVGNRLACTCVRMMRRRTFSIPTRTLPPPLPRPCTHSPCRPSVRSFSGNVMNTFTDPKLCASNNHRSLIDGSPGTHYSCSTCPFATKLLRLLLLPYLGITALTY